MKVPLFHTPDEKTLVFKGLWVLQASVASVGVQTFPAAYAASNVLTCAGVRAQEGCTQSRAHTGMQER